MDSCLRALTNQSSVPHHTTQVLRQQTGRNCLLCSPLAHGGVAREGIRGLEKIPGGLLDLSTARHFLEFALAKK